MALTDAVYGAAAGCFWLWPGKIVDHLFYEVDLLLGELVGGPLRIASIAAVAVLVEREHTRVLNLPDRLAEIADPAL